MKKMLTLVFTCMALYSAAQLKDSVFHFKKAFSFNPVVLAATDNTAMLGAECRLENNIALVLDAGYIFSSYYIQDALKGTSGFTLRPGVKLYNKSEKTFYQFQVWYKQVDYKLVDWLGKGCVAGVPTYEQRQEFAYRKKALSLNVMAGELYHLSDAVLLELYGGVGVKIKAQRPVEKGACYRNSEGTGAFSMFREKYSTINAPCGIKILVAIK